MLINWQRMEVDCNNTKEFPKVRRYEGTKVRRYEGTLGIQILGSIHE